MGEIKLSLKTGCLKTARQLSGILKHEVVKLTGDSMDISKEQIRAALGAHLRRELDRTDEKRLNGSEPYQTDIPALDLQTFKRSQADPADLLKILSNSVKKELAGQGGSINLDECDIEQVKTFLSVSGLPEIPDDDPMVKFVHRELAKVQQAIFEIEKERTQGNFNSQIENSTLARFSEQPPAVIPPKKEMPALSKYIEQYLDEGVSDGLWKASTLKEYKNHLAMFLEILGDMPLDAIDYEKTRQFFDNIKQLPANRKKVKRYRTKSTAQLLDMKIPEKDRITIKTVNNIMTSVSAFFAWAVTRGYMQLNHAKSMRVKQTKQASKLKDAFTDDEINQIILTISEYKNVPESSHRYWIPMIALYTGARLEEIAQLHTGDIEQVDGIWCIDINDDGPKKLKNINSRRVVPVHQALIDAGFLDFHANARKSKSSQLFAHLKPMKGKYGHYISRWFGPMLKPLGIKTADHNVSFHSFRHTFITRAKHLDLPEGYVKQIVGHSAGSITFGVYGKGYEIPKLKEIIDQVTFS
jgi:integrase